MKLIKLLIVVTTAVLLLQRCSVSDKVSERSADLVFLGAKVYTANKQQQSASAFVVESGVFVYVGNDEGAKEYITPQTQVIHLKGERVLPGLHDNHIHPGGILEFERCDMEGTSLNFSEIATFLKECLNRLKPGADEWLLGEQWSFSSGNKPTDEFLTIRAALDSVSSEIPISLSGNDGHHGAYNSIALALAKNKAGKRIGLNKDSLNSDFVEFKKVVGVDTRGNPDGMVNEQARSLMGSPSMIEGDIDKIIKNAYQIPQRLNAIGITSIRDAYYVDESAPYYKTLSDDGRLSLRVTLSQFYNPLSYLDADGKVDWSAISKEAASVRDKYAAVSNISANSLKLFIDGVAEGNPLSTPPALPNAAMLANYKQPMFDVNDKTHQLTIKGYVDLEGDSCKSESMDIASFIRKHGHHPGQCIKSNGVLESPRDIEMEFVRRFDKEGYTLHLHVIGDRALRTALDAFENAEKLNGVSKQPHSLAHLQFIHPDDIKRIGDLGLYLAYTYAWIKVDPEYDLSVMPFIDEIIDSSDLYKDKYYSFKQAYPVKSTKDAGATLIAGSDAPVDTRDPRPFENMQQAVTRAGSNGETYNKLEAISIYDVIDAYTINGAKAMSQEQLVGSIEVGKRADFIILNQDIIQLAESNPTAIKSTKVLSTWFDGNLVYQIKE